jgi:hypothetical protein
LKSLPGGTASPRQILELKKQVEIITHANKAFATEGVHVMADLPLGWAAYAQFQLRLSRLHELNDHCWGLEGALNLIFDPNFSPDHTSADEFRRAAASSSRKRRKHRSRFMGDKEVIHVPDKRDMVEQVVAKQALQKIEDQVENPVDLRLLEGLAFGHDYGHLAPLLGQRAISLRSRALRLRRRFAHFKPSFNGDVAVAHHE